MKHKWTLALCAALHGVLGYSQTFEWARSATAANANGVYGKSVCTDGDGNVITVGSFRGTVDFDPGPGVHNLTGPNNVLNAYIQKLDANGNLVFAHGFGNMADDGANDVAVDPDNNIYIAGYFSGPVDFDPGTGISMLTSVSNSTDGFVLRLDPAGAFLSAFSFGAAFEDAATAISANNDSYVVGGSFKGVVDFNPGAGNTWTDSNGETKAFLARYTSSGFTNVSIPGDVTRVNSVKVDANGDVYFAGMTHGGDFDPGMQVYNLATSPTFSYTSYVCKWSATWALQWAKALLSSYENEAFDLDISGSSCVVTGQYETYVNFGPGIILNSGGGIDGYAWKLDSDGNHEWAKNIASGPGEGVGTSIAVNELDGSVTVGGYFQGAADFNPGTGTHSLTSAGDQDAFMVQLDATGEFLTANRIGAAAEDEIHSLCLDAADNLFFTGFYTGTVDVDPNASTHNLVSPGAPGMMVVKWSNCILPALPLNTTASDALSICGSGSTVLTATGTGTLGWYSAPTGGTYLGGGTSFNTGNLTASTPFYLQDSTCAAGPRQTIIVTVNPGVADQAVSAADGTLCSGGSTSINLAGSEVGTSYYLRNDADNAIVAGPVAGTGAALSLPTPPLSSTTTFNVQGVRAGVNKAVEFAQTISHARLGTDNRGVGAEVTVQMKVKLAPQPYNQFLLYKYNGSSGYLLVVDANGKVKFDGRDGSPYRSSGPSTTTVADNTWHVVTGVVRNGDWEIYVDGVLENSFDSSPGSLGVDSNGELYVASSGANYTAMSLDDLAIFNTALPVATILSYGTNCLTGSEPGLTGYFNCNEATGGVLTDLSPTGIDGQLWSTDVSSCWVAGDAACFAANGCTLEMGSTVTVTVNAAPVATATLDGGVLTASPAAAAYQWVDCDDAYAPIAGATSQTFIPAGNGNYAVIVSENGCADTSACVQILTTGMEESGAMQGITVYPNPSHGSFTVELGGSFGQASLQLMDLTGRTVAVKQVANTQRIHLDVDVPQGVYFVVIHGDSGRQAIYKVVVE